MATCQFPTCGDIAANLEWMRSQMRQAAEGGAHLAHLGEGALSRYAGADLAGFDGYDWTGLRAANEEILAEARRLRLWVVAGSAHPLGAGLKPHDSAYVIDDTGRLRDRYDKRFCSGDPDGASGDLAHYVPGDHAMTFRPRGVLCGVLNRCGAELLFQVLTEREETSSIASAQPFSGWTRTSLRRDDRPTHFAGNILETGTTLYRLDHARSATAR